MEIKSKFDEKTERLFKASLSDFQIRQIRIVFGLFIILYGFFGISDLYYFPDIWGMMLTIRFIIVIPVLGLALLASFDSRFVAYHQYVLATAFIVGGMGIAFMVAFAPENIIYYGGMFMILFSGYLLIKMRFIPASISGWSIIAFYGVCYLVIHAELQADFIFGTLFFIGANVIGMLGVYNIESMNRNKFLKDLEIERVNKALSKKVSMQLQTIDKINMETIFAFAKLVEARDNNTGQHISNVGKYTRVIALNLDDSQFKDEMYSQRDFARIIQVSSVLHDLGKVGIPDAILNKKGKLTRDEFEVMETHTIIGSELLGYVIKSNDSNEFLQMGLEITKYHHEKYDGSGYNEGLSKDDIPLSARIMGLCDVYDALISKRPYKEAYPHSDAVRIIKASSGSHFDPAIVDVFLKHEKTFFNIKEGNI